MKSVVITEPNEVSDYTSSIFYSFITMEATRISIKQVIISMTMLKFSSVSC